MPARQPRSSRPALALLLLLLAALVPVQAQEGDARGDLVAARLGVGQANLTEGIEATFHLEVAWAAPAGSTEAVVANVSFEVDGQPLGNASVTVQAGATANATSPPWPTLLGNHTVRARIDGAGDVNESDEANNELNITVEVFPRPPEQPDLLVLDVGPEDSQPVTGTNTTLKARLLNAGQADARGNFTLRFLLDGRVLGNVTVPGLTAGNGVTLRSEPFMVQAGNHTAGAFADADNAIAEEHETNNELELLFVPAPPRFDAVDVRVTDVVLEPLHPVEGQNVTFTAHLANAGADAGNFTVRFLMDNRTLSEANVSGLAGNGSAQAGSGPWTATPGEHELVVQADPENNLTDASRLNNAFPLRLRIPARGERADLVVDEVVVPAKIGVNQQVRLIAVVRNNGTWPSQPTEARFVVDGQNLGNVPLDALAPGQTARLPSEAWKATRGPHTVMVRVDPDNLVPELPPPENNLAVRRLTIPHGPQVNRSALPDLLVAKVSWDPPVVTPGAEVVLRAVVRNPGNATAGDFALEFLVDGQALDRQHVNGVGTAEVVVMSRPWKALPGRHTLGAHADPNDLVVEREEGNNLAYGVVDVAGGGLFGAQQVPGPEVAALLAALGLAALTGRKRRGPD